MTDEFHKYTFDLGLFDVDVDEGYSLNSDKTSCFYIDGRSWTHDPDAQEVYGAAMEDVVRAAYDISEDDVAPEWPFDVVAGGETGGMVPGYELARRIGKPYGYVRKAAKGHGMESRCEGVDVAGKDVLLVEDTATTGRSVRDFGAAVRDEGGNMDDCLVLYDREQGAEAAVAAEGARLHPVATISNLLAYAETHGRLAAEDIAAVRAELDCEPENPDSI